MEEMLVQHCSSRWPNSTFVPSLEYARQLAADVRAITGAAAAVNLVPCCKLAGADIRTAPLDSANGGCEAMLVPLANGRFRIVVDEGILLPASDVSRHRWRFRVAHELAHTFFYVRRTGGKPYRVTGGGTEVEEAFCDEFARALLVPSRRWSDAADIIRAQEAHDVSLEVAARQAARAGSPRVGLWWWQEQGSSGNGAVLEQWTSDNRIGRELGVVRYRTRAADIGVVLEAARRRLGRACSFALLPHRNQALAVLR